MAEAVEKALELEHPGLQHGSLANGHVEEKFDFSSNRSVADTLSDYEDAVSNHDKHLNAERTTSHPSQVLTSSRSGVDVEQATQDFHDLQKELSHQSRRYLATQKSGRESPPSATRDVEKAISSSDTASEVHWDLEATLRGKRVAEMESGIRSKRIGWWAPSVQPKPCPHTL